jgi:hypothetical protein
MERSIKKQINLINIITRVEVNSDKTNYVILDVWETKLDTLVFIFNNKET